MSRVHRFMPLLVLTLLAATPAAAALTVQADAASRLVVHVPGEAPRAYHLEASARTRVAWSIADAPADALALDPHVARSVTLAAGTHAFRVTHAADAGWLLLVPVDPTEPGAAAAFPRTRPLALWLTDHVGVTAAIGGVVAAAAAGAVWLAWGRRALRQKA